MMKNLIILDRYLPPNVAPIITQWIDVYNCDFTISKSRNTKLGDYRPPQRGNPHRISVNHDLNPFAFLITSVHEFAHLKAWNIHKNKIKPHGTEWKNIFKSMMLPFIEQNIFPNDITQALESYLKNPAASGCTDLNLYRTLRRYNVVPSHPVPFTTLENIPEGSFFKIRNGKKFKKLERVRKRFKCLELDSKRLYLVSPIAEVSVLTLN